MFTRTNLRSAAALAFALGATSGIARLMLMVLNGQPAIDFFGVWTAGNMWSAGLDPYGPAFRQVGSEIVEMKWMTPVFWFYPPQWWLFAVPLNLISPQAALDVWQWGNLAFLLLSAFLAWRAADMFSDPPPLWQRLGFVFALVTMEATSFNIFAGQTAFLTMLGMAALLNGISCRRNFLMAAGIFILLLKPQIGIPVVIVALARSQTRMPALAALVATGIACLPFLFSSGLTGAIGSLLALLGNLSAYAAHPFNAPHVLMGIIQFFSLASVTAPSALILAPFSAIVIMALLWWTARQTGAPPAPEIVWLIFVLGIVLIVPLHNYDMVFVSTVLLTLNSLPRFAALLALSGFILLHRASDIAWMLTGTEVELWQAPAGTAGLLLMLAALVIAARAPRRRLPHDPAIGNDVRSFDQDKSLQL